MNPTGYTVGLGEGTKISSRVLKPPGGGSSDIFANPEAEIPTPRRTKNYMQMQSSVFNSSSSSEGSASSQDSRPKSGNDSYNNLFGSDECKTPQKLHTPMKSDIFSIEGPISDFLTVNGSPRAYTPRNPVTGDGMSTSDSLQRRSGRQRGGNPVTGEGYEAREEKEPAPPQRQGRIPPGGFSSQLW